MNDKTKGKSLRRCIGFSTVFSCKATTATCIPVKQTAFQYVFFCATIASTQPFTFGSIEFVFEADFFVKNG